jgi:hypothetical protein
MAATSELYGYTVIGLWIGDEPIVAGVIEGDHPMVDAAGIGDEYQRWATHVYAEDAESAEAYAVEEMSGEGEEDEEG